MISEFVSSGICSGKFYVEESDPSPLFLQIHMSVFMLKFYIFLHNHFHVLI